MKQWKLVIALNWLILSLIIPYLSFNFTHFYSFRDLLIVPRINNIEWDGRPLDFLVQHIYNSLIDFRLEPWSIYSGMFRILFFVGTLISWWGFGIIRHILESESGALKQSIFRGSWIWLITCLYTYNPWTLERFLMGQYYVLAGYFLMPIGFWLILKWFLDGSNTSFKFWNKEVRDLCLFLVILSLVNIHQVVFMFMSFLALIISLIAHKCKNFRIVSQNNLSKGVKLLWNFSWFWIPIVLLNLFQFWGQTAAGLSGDKTEIILAFSPKVLEGQNLFERVLIGSASWNTPTFVEIYSNLSLSGRISIHSYLGDLAYFTLYFNSVWAWLIVGILGLCWVGIVCKIWSLKGDHTKLIFGLLSFLSILSLILSFGLNSSSNLVAQLFYSISGSYILRESGKFWSLFWLCLLIIFSVYSKVLGKWLQLVLGVTLTLMLVGNIGLFLSLQKVVNYYDFPNIYTNIQRSCGKEDKLLFLPIESYTVTSYSPSVFVINPLTKFSSCQIIEPQVSLASENSKVLLSQNLIANGILQALNNVITGEINVVEFLVLLKEIGITNLVIEEFGNQKLQILNQKLKNMLEPEEKSGSISWYKI